MLGEQGLFLETERSKKKEMFGPVRGGATTVQMERPPVPNACAR